MDLRLELDAVNRLDATAHDALCGTDFLLTWDKSRPALEYILDVARIVKSMREENISPKIFDSGIAVSHFRDNSTRTRFSFASACNLLGLQVQDLDEGTSQIAHGETARETANMISFMAEVIGIRDDIYIGKGHTYMLDVSQAVEEGHADGVLEQRPSVINLQCDIDHPTQSMSDLMHIVNQFGGVEALRGKRVAMTWAYSPSYGKPLSVPQGIIGLFTRFGMEVTLAFPEGYTLLGETVQRAKSNAKDSGGGFRHCDSMEEAFMGADVVYPKSWAPFRVMEERTTLVERGDRKGLDALETECLETNRRYQNWQCTEKLMQTTNDALYMHCLPADITGVSCETGEVDSRVFERFRVPLFRQASYKPYIIAAMIMSSRIGNLREILMQKLEKRPKRIL